MLEIYIKLLPVFGFFLLGITLRGLRLAQHSHGALLLRLMFFVTLPVLILIKLTQTHIGIDKLYLPLINILINLGCMGLMLLLTRRMEIPRATLGVMLVSSMIINNLFAFPFVLAVLGDQAFTDAVIFDVGNGIMTLTLSYVVAFSYGPGGVSLRDTMLNVLKLPPIWALVVAALMNLNSVYLPEQTVALLEPVGLLTSPLILIALGIYFTPRIRHLRLVLMTVSVRMLFGACIGVALASLFGLEGETFMVIALLASAPIGFNALTFASLAKLDMAFASSAVSVSILTGVVSMPLLMYFMQV